MKEKITKRMINTNRTIFFACSVLIIIFLLTVFSFFQNNRRSVSVQPNSSVRKTNLVTITPFPTRETIIEGQIVENGKESKTYIDKTAGFSFTLPYNQFQLIESKEGESVQFKGYGITIYSNYRGGSKKQWYIDNFGNNEGYEVKYEDYKVDGYNALIVGTYDPGSMGGRSVYVFKGNTVYNIHFSYSGSENNDAIKKLASGFKFL